MVTNRPLPSADARTFQTRVLHVVSRIPSGRVATYGDVAALAGRPRAARAVGTILRLANRPGLPYHRVVAAGGRVSGYGRWPHLKQQLLQAEGHPIRGGRLADFGATRWTG